MEYLMPINQLNYLQFINHSVGSCKIVCKYTACQTKLCVVSAGNHLFLRVKFQNGRHWPKDFFFYCPVERKCYLILKIYSSRTAAIFWISPLTLYWILFFFKSGGEIFFSLFTSIPCEIPKSCMDYTAVPWPCPAGLTQYNITWPKIDHRHTKNYTSSLVCF